MKKIGIMGGTFNPIHNGHLIIAQSALTSLALDKVWFMPAGDPPHKDDNILDKKYRVEMVKRAIEDNESFELFTYETEKERPSYSAVTMTEIDEKYHDCHFYFIMGTDSFIKFEKWYKPEVICAHTSLVVANRNNVSKEEILGKKKAYEDKFSADIYFIDTPQIEISSTKIREGMEKDLPMIRYLIPEKVYDYLKNNDIYTSDTLQ